MADSARPEMLVSTAWLAQHLRAPGLRLVEVDGDPSAYDQGHTPGAVGWNWQTQLCDQVRRDPLTKEPFERLMNESGITPTTIVFYGDNHNLKYLLGVPKVRNYDGSWTEWGNLVGAPIERTP